MNKLQLIIACGVILVAGVTWQVASDAKLNQASNLATAHTVATETSSLPNNQDIN